MDKSICFGLWFQRGNSPARQRGSEQQRWGEQEANVHPCRKWGERSGLGWAHSLSKPVRSGVLPPVRLFIPKFHTLPAQRHPLRTRWGNAWTSEWHSHSNHHSHAKRHNRELIYTRVCAALHLKLCLYNGLCEYKLVVMPFLWSFETWKCHAPLSQLRCLGLLYFSSCD